MKKLFQITVSTFIVLFYYSTANAQLLGSGTISFNNHTGYDVQVILEATDDTYAGASSWLQSNAITVNAYSGWSSYTPCVVQAMVGWAYCSFSSYTCPVSSPTVIWRNARIILSSSTGCSPTTGCLTDPYGCGTFGSSCASPYYFSSCSYYATWNTVPGSCGDGADVEIEIW